MPGFKKFERPAELPALALAYMGDAVYELAVRTHLVGKGLTRVNRLHGEAVRYVNAGAQAGVLKKIEGSLAEEELAVVRRGRNAKSSHTPQGAGVLAYRHSTALEALIGYLYLKGDHMRLDKILGDVFQIIEENNR